MTNVTLGFIWESLGPYHIARLRALAERCGARSVVGIEISTRTDTYQWRRGEMSGLRVVSLVNNVPAESVSVMTVFRGVRQVIRKEAIDVLFIPSYWPKSSVAALMAAKHERKRIVIMSDSHLQSGENGIVALFAKKLLARRFDAAFVAGRMHRSFFRKLGVVEEHILEGYDVVDNAYFCRSAERARSEFKTWRTELELPDRYILSLGRFVKKKNLHTIVHAFALAQKREQLNGHDLVFVGDGPERKAIIEAAVEFGIPVFENGGASRGRLEGPAIRIYPFAQIDRTPVYYALATCFVLASITEEWGLVVNEAMAAGCPVAVSCVAGCAPDLVIHGVTGYRFRPCVRL